MLIMSLSRHSSEKMRGQSVALVAPLWEKFLSLKYFILHPTQPSPFSHLSIEEERQLLLLENQLLQDEIATLQKQLGEQLIVSSQIDQINPLTQISKHQQRSIQLLEKRIRALPARVIFRTFDSWNSSLWINVGKANNKTAENTLIGLNSPVIVGQAIVGLVDYVGENQSRVRLISDSRLTPSVRAARGGEQEALISEQIERLLQQMTHRKSLRITAVGRRCLTGPTKESQQNRRPFT